MLVMLKQSCAQVHVLTTSAGKTLSQRPLLLRRAESLQTSLQAVARSQAEIRIQLAVRLWVTHLPLG